MRFFLQILAIVISLSFVNCGCAMSINPPMGPIVTYQEDEVAQEAAQEADGKEKQDEGEEQDAEETDEEENVIQLPPSQVNEKEIRLHMFDGTVIAGEMSTDVITVDTEFGTLEIPVSKIQVLSPGLDSYPQKLTDLDDLVEQLGSADYKTRQAARKALTLLGVRIKHELDRFDDGGNAERKKHLDELKKEILEQEMELSDSEDGPIKPYIRGDSVETPDFTVVGKIQQSQFKVKSKYGELTVNLQDVRMIDRQRTGGQEIRRTVSVSGSHFVQSNLKSTAIKVNKGDVISISASGAITMTPWGANRTSNPDGSTNYGWYLQNQIEGGALCAKVGDNSTPIKVGSKHRFVAKKAGMLKLGIGMQQAYAGGNYQFPGQYKVKITVQPGG